MTLSEYRFALSTLTPAQQVTFGSRRDAAGTVDGNLAALASASDRERYERVAVAAARDASYAAKVSAVAAERASLSAWWSISAAMVVVIAREGA